MTSATEARSHDVNTEFEGFDIVAIPGRKFEIVRSITENTLYLLERKNRILVVEPFQSLPTLIRDARRQKRAWKFEYGLRQERDNLWIYTPPPLGLPGHTRWKITNDVNSFVLAQRIKRVARRLQFRDPLVWSFIYNAGRIQRHLRGR